MQHHKFCFFDSAILDGESPKEGTYIRISDEWLRKLYPKLKKHQFETLFSHEKVNGFSEEDTLLFHDDLIFLLENLKSEDSNNKECKKLYDLLTQAIATGQMVIHIDGSPAECGLVHHFSLCKELPLEIDFNNFQKDAVIIQDQFIFENDYVFKKVKMAWHRIQNLHEGFAYHGITILTKEMSKNLLIAIEQFLAESQTEQVEYFLGDDLNKLIQVLNTAIQEDYFVIHFGI